MVPIWKEPKENEQLLRAFAMGDSTALPSLATFLFAESDVQCAQSRINADSPQNVFNSVVSIVDRLLKAARKSGDRFQAMKNASFEMKALKFGKDIKEFLGILGSIRGAAGI